MADAQRYRVGDLTIDVGRQRVMRGEAAIALPKLSYELLMALVRAAPNLASLDTLNEQVWPKAVVSPETVSQRVKLLRDALEDDPRAPRYIEGLRGRGYRLVPSVEREESATPVSAGGASDSGHAPATSNALGANDVPALGAATGVTATATLPQWRQRPTLLWGPAVVIALLGCVFLARYLTHTDRQAPRTSLEVVAVRPQGVAVLPFDNLSAEPGNDYIAAGIADSVLHQLASVPELIVVARSSSFALGKPTPEAGEAGRGLGVRYLVTGSVQRAGKLIRVTAQLTDTTRNAALWSLKLDRTVDSVFELQDQIAQQVAQQLDVTLQRGPVRYDRFGTDAYLAFLHGRALIESRKVKDVDESIREFSRAIELAPAFAAALAELARAKLQRASLESDAAARADALQTELKSLIERAIEIDPAAGEPYFLRAFLKEDREDSTGTEADFLKGLQLAPNFGPGLRAYAQYLIDKDRYEEALAQLDRARLVDPLSAENHYVKGEVMRSVYYRYDEAATLYLQALAVQPEFYPAYTRLATVRWETGRLAEAIGYAEKSTAIEPAVEWSRERLVWFYVDIGDLDAARDVVRGFVSNSRAAAAAEALLCYRAGKLEESMKLLQTHLDDPDFHIGFAFYASTNAVIDLAIAKQDPSAARKFLTSLIWPAKAATPGTVDADSFPAVVQLATLEHRVGSQAAADDLAGKILNYLDQGPNPRLIAGWDEWSRAAVNANQGHDDLALKHLESLNQSGHRVGWWARIDRDPAFAALRSTPRFQAIVANSKAWLEGQQQQLSQMRDRGEVPRRPAEHLSPHGC